MINVYIKKADKSLEVDFDNLPKVSQEAIIDYGLRQLLNDAHSGIKDADEAFAKSEAKLQGFIDGVVKVARASAASPVQKYANIYWQEFLCAKTGKLVKEIKYLYKQNGVETVRKHVCELLEIDFDEQQAEFTSLGEQAVLNVEELIAESKVDVSGLIQ